MSDTRVSIRLGVEGQAEIKRAFDDVSKSGEAAFKNVATSMDSAAASADRHRRVVVAGAAATAGALSLASPALLAASVATKNLANDNAILASGLGLTSKALATGATATAAAAVSARNFAETLSPTVTATRLLASAAGVALPLLGPIAIALVGFKLGAEAVEKASDDLAKLVDVAKRAEAVDVSAPFLRSFTGLGKGLRIEVDEMERGLAKASELVKDKFQQPNALTKQFSDLYSSGFAGPEPLQATKLLDVAKTTEDRIRAGIVGMTELEAAGQKFAMLDLGEKLFPQAVVDRLRTGQTTAAQLLSDLDAARAKELLSPDDGPRALELARNIEAAKREIKDAWAVSLDFSGAAMAIDTAWLGILRTTGDLSIAINTGLAGALAEVNRRAKETSDYVEKIGNASLWTKIYNVLPKLPGNGGVVDAPPGGFPEFGPAVPAGFQPPIGFHVGTEMFGPAMPAAERASAAPRAAGGGRDTLTGMQTYLVDLEKSRDLAKAEYETIGLGNQARERAIDLAKAQGAAQKDFERGLRNSAALTDEETNRINAAADATARWKEQAKDLQDAITFSSDATKDFVKGLAGGMREGKSAIEAATEAVSRLSAKLMDKALDAGVDSLFKGAGGGGIGGMIASFYGGGGGGLSSSAIGDIGSYSSGFAGGGRIYGPGTGTSDSILARVSDGEFVVKAAATARHYDVLEAINQDRFPRFAGGGPVGGGRSEDSAMPRLGMMVGASQAPAPNVTIHVHGNADEDTTRDMVKQLAQQMAKHNREFAGNVVKVVSDARQRDPAFRRG